MSTDNNNNVAEKSNNQFNNERTQSNIDILRQFKEGNMDALK